jgi:gamma-butyrobetaine dioxygenase
MTSDTMTTTTTAIRTLTIDPSHLRIDWANGDVSRLLHFWLRDNCPQLLHPSTNHRVVETSSIPVDVRPTSAELDPDGAVRLVWADGHRSTFEAAWLRANDYSSGARYQPAPPALWRTSDLGDIPRASYPQVTSDPAVREAFLSGFVAHGLGLLSDVPCVDGTVLDVAATFGEIRTTSWGTVFDVKSIEDANSLAYTNLPLVTHTDEGYRDPAPTVQLQHFLIADASGGASTLVDGFAIAEDMRAEHPEYFELLSSTMLDFHFADSTAEHEARAAVISLNPDGSLRAIRFSNHSARPFRLPAEIMERYYAAYVEFGRRRESDRYQLKIEMGAGDLYMVDNHRVLHGRTGFSSGGARHLQSCYIERDELVSRLTVLRRSLAPSA